MAQLLNLVKPKKIAYAFLPFDPAILLLGIYSEDMTPQI